MPKTLYEVFTGEKPELQETKTWTTEMSREGLQSRMEIIEDLLDGGKQRRGLKPMLKRQRQEILDELDRRDNESNKDNSPNIN